MEDKKVYAAYSKKAEILNNSSSGGMFTEFAEAIINEGGAVCGAVMDTDFVVRHKMVYTLEELKMLAGSKYVQSSLAGIFISIKEELENGKKVLFSGTPCQVAGLLRYVGKEYSNLYTCDLVCHGVVLPQFFEKYKTYIQELHGADITAYKFRLKKPAWNRYSTKVSFSNGEIHLKTFRNDPYMQGFLSDYFLKEECFSCQYSNLNRISDITIGDFWGGDVSEEEQRRGVSLLIINSEKGRELVEACKDSVEIREADMAQVLEGNRSLSEPFPKPDGYEDAQRELKEVEFSEILKKYCSVNGKVYFDALLPKEKDYYEKVIVIPSDAVGSKGDEAMVRGVLNLFQGRKIELYTQRNELWKGWLIDRNGEFEESYYELKDMADTIHEPVQMVIIGADIMDGLFGKEDTLTRINIAEKVIDEGGRVDVFSCSFRSNANLDILEKIVNVGNRIHFHLREQSSLHNFEAQTGLKADYFPDLAFLCEKHATERTEKICEVLKEWKDEGRDIVAVNFCEHSFKGFYRDANDVNRKKYVADAVDAILKAAPNAAIVLISHDTKRWPGHYEDCWYSNVAKDYLSEVDSERKVLVLDEFLTEAELLEVMSYADVAVSGRMHLTIAGIRNNVIPIGYMGMSKDASFFNVEKFRGMYMERIGRDDLVVSSCEELKVLLRDVLVHKNDIKKNIAIRNNEQGDVNAALINQYRAQIGLPELVMNDNEVCVKHVLNETVLRDYIAQRERTIKDNTFLYWEEKDSILADKDKVVNDYQAMLAEKNGQVEKLNNQIEEKERVILERERTILERERTIEERERTIREREYTIQEKENKTQEKEKEIEEKTQIIRNKEGHIELLLQAEREFVNVKNSKCGRLMYAWWGLKEKLLPQGSKRRILARIIKMFIRHPIYMLKKCTPGRIARTLHYMKMPEW